MELSLIPTPLAMSLTEVPWNPFWEKRSMAASNIFSLVLGPSVFWGLPRGVLVSFMFPH
jgi:hypothetical protein